MAQLDISEARFKEASLVTACYLLMFSLTQVVQGLSRTRMEFQAKAKKQHFDRYTDPRMRPLDRVVGNTLEWLPIFLGLFWLSALLGADCITLGWAYVLCRVFYAGLVYGGWGISKTTGAKFPILLATVPCYVILGKLAAQVFSRALA
jgi:uncharacterized membrane protein YecN with MAPEG domain